MSERAFTDPMQMTPNGFKAWWHAQFAHYHWNRDTEWHEVKPGATVHVAIGGFTVEILIIDEAQDV